MGKIIFFFTVWLFCGNQLKAQSLYMPRNVQNAVAAGTRTLTGIPGANYWQNHAHYTIEATVHPNTQLISGKETIQYFNNSPDTLRTLNIRFVNNIHKPQSPRAGQVAPDFLTTGLEMLSFQMNGEAYTIDSRQWGTTNDVVLKNPILPKTNARLEIAWQYPLSKKSGREGQIDSNTFFCAYFYPRISVYDDYNGWDRLPHSDGQEFYNDFNNYRVTIKAPANYVVWSTGILQNPEAVLDATIYKRFQESKKTDEVIHIANASEMQAGKVTRQQEWNHWIFTADTISDFTFGLSNHFVWDAGSVAIDGRRISVQAAYKDTARDFSHAVDWAKDALKWFSEKLPGIAYPYPTMTAFQGFADMEYPMMVNDASTPDTAFSRLVLEHEIAHTYFPFYMGTNETRYAYMDEGWATTFEYLIGLDRNGAAKADAQYKKFRVKSWILNNATEMDQPLITMSSQLSGVGYSRNSYVKASLSYLALKDLLGDVVFKKALHHYMQLWHGRHPIPWDYFNAINAGAKQNLNWFWNNWFFSNNYIDLQLQWAQQNPGMLKLKIFNKGGFAIPFDVVIQTTDGVETRHHYTPAVWEKQPQTLRLNIPVKATVQQVVLDGGIFMDAVPTDNVRKVEGFKK